MAAAKKKRSSAGANQPSGATQAPGNTVHNTGKVASYVSGQASKNGHKRGASMTKSNGQISC